MACTILVFSGWTTKAQAEVSAGPALKWIFLSRSTAGVLKAEGPSVRYQPGVGYQLEAEAGDGVSWLVLHQRDGGRIERFDFMQDAWWSPKSGGADTFWLVMWLSGSPPELVSRLLRGDPIINDPERIRQILWELRRLQLAQASFGSQPYAPVRFAGAWRAPPEGYAWNVFANGPAGVARYDIE